jgi:hypothetical protein
VREVLSVQPVHPSEQLALRRLVRVLEPADQFPERLEDLAGAVHEVIEKRTSLHETHRGMGAKVHWSGSWMRPYHFGDPAAEYRAVREGVSLMDVGTLGKFLMAGEHARDLADRVFVMSSRPGRILVERKIDIPRPRDLDVAFTQGFQDIVHELRSHIVKGRQ